MLLMSKTYVGSRLRQLRRERNLSQASLAATLQLSASYVNQIEHDVRPLTVPVLKRITEAFGVDATFFSRDDDSRLLAELKDVVEDQELGTPHIELQELSELVYRHPAVARSVVEIHRRYSNARDKLTLATDSRVSSSEPLSMPHDEVRDFFYSRQNYLDDLDHAAEALAATIGVSCLGTDSTYWPLTYHIIRDVVIDVPTSSTEHGGLYHLDTATSTLSLSPILSSGQRAFRIALELAYLDAGQLIDAHVAAEPFSSATSVDLARRGIASYFAAATLLPYTLMHSESEKHGYDVDYLCHVFGVGYETVASRLSTLQRANMRGVPFTFVRVDRAGNISKRQSATGYHFSTSGGTCPLWGIYESFARPGESVRQHAMMPDGRTYLWVARTVRHHRFQFNETEKLFAIGLGCETRHAERTIYARGLPLDDATQAIPIGAGCRVCPRENCAQRAFPSIHHGIEVDPHTTSIAPY